MNESTRKYLVEEFGYLHPVFETLDKYNPKIAEAVAASRKELIPGKKGPKGVLSTKVKELIITAVEVSLGRGEKGKSHARKAVRAGATTAEVFEAVALCIYLAGMTTWVDSGMEAVKAAEEEYAKAKRGEKFRWTAEVSKR
jgi:alkylhydroperoxidase/carboxymuconolactone decarboxylase family protein YurZ